MNTGCRVAVAVIVITLAAAAQEAAKQANSASPLQPLQFLVGHWRGETQGQPGQGKGERHYGLVLGGKFIRGINRTVYPPQKKNPKGEVHEDVGYFSFDRGRKRLVLRQFHVEGFVNEYVEKHGGDDARNPHPVSPTSGETRAGQPTTMFETERIENIPEGWRARETYKIVSPDEFIEIFELAEPQKEFVVYAQSRWKRVK